MSPPALADTNLFKPIKVGSVTLKNRLAFAPTTRLRNAEGGFATNLVQKHYEDRAENNGGLLIAEASFVSPQAGLFPGVPMIHTEEQAKTWKPITDSVHAKGSSIALQVWYLGRASYPAILKAAGLPMLAPSALYMDEESEKAAIEAGNPVRAMTTEEIHQLIADFKQAAIYAIKVAGFDFVELHSAHMYALCQFIDINSNKRTDEYGGSIEKRAKLVLDVVDAVCEAVGPEHVGIRFSPYVTWQGGSGADSPLLHPIAQYSYIFSELERRGKEGKRIAYIHNIEARVGRGIDVKDGPEHSSEWVRQIWKGVLIRAGGYLHQPDYANLIKDVNDNDRTLIGVSRYYTSNPDLAERLKKGLELSPYERDNFYSQGNYGYNTYGKSGEKNLDKDSDVAKEKAVPLV
ncbi:unnamed protein product [Ambrosiozyma monospora]|uniref:Unnamed protein product n=1 Tax=Ambrosiozyma monospora TaxID=43982 RepID=A0A9W6YVI4_AMBMO|nr:unnamed protein product [Ambrosiozyma monospora]